MRRLADCADRRKTFNAYLIARPFQFGLWLDMLAKHIQHLLATTQNHAYDAGRVTALLQTWVSLTVVVHTLQL